jgi:hypothetical protein
MTTAAMSTTTTTAEMVASLHSGSVFIASVVAGNAYMALPVARLVALKVIERLRPVAWYRSRIAMTGIIAVVDVSVKAVGAMKPGPGS